MSPTAPVVDTSVLVDMAIPGRPRYEEAQRLTLLFERQGIVPWVPAHGIFELHAAIVSEGLEEPADPTRFPSDEHPLELHVVDVDRVFLRLYLRQELPALRAGDLIFAALALGAHRPLISEDAPLRRAVQDAGGQAFTIREYLDAFGPTRADNGPTANPGRPA